MKFNFPRTFGQEEAKESLRRALEQERFPHALLIHGEPGLGQHALLLDAAQILSCESKTERPCGKCFYCKAFQSASLDTVHYLIPLVKKEKGGSSEEDGDLDSAQIEELSGLIEDWHKLPYGFSVSEKAQGHVSQTSELLGRLAYAGNGGRPRIVLVPYLEALNLHAANRLLKTLEEPSAGVYFLIASDNRASLLPTLLSRCVHLGLSPLSAGAFREAADSLSAQVGKPFAPRLLPFAEGSPGVYLDLLERGGEELLEESAQFLAAVASPDWRVFADHAAQGSAAEGLEESARLIQFLMRCVRVHQSLRVKHPEVQKGSVGREGFQQTLKALGKEGWDPSLAAYLGPLENISDLQEFTAYLQSAYQAVKNYARPPSALLGLYLEYKAKA